MAKKSPPKKRRWVSLSLPDELVERIEAQAELEIRNRSQMIKALLLRALATHEKTA